MTVHGIAYVEFHCEDAHKYAAALRADYGFTVAEPAPAAGPVRPGLTRLTARQGGITVVLCSAADPGDPVSAFVGRHGDGVAVLALSCEDTADALARTEAAVRRGAVRIDATTVAGYGDLALRFVGRDDPLLAGFEPDPSALLQEVDHVAVCVPAGELAAAVRYSREALGFSAIFSEYLEIGAQAMNSEVVQSPGGGVTLTLLEPDAAREPGQIDGFLDAHGGTGVQHLAFRTDDIAGAVRTLSGRGVTFLTTPGSYYDALPERLGGTSIAAGVLRELNLLVDQDHGGQLFQIFTRSTHPRNTLFLELIERRGAGTFGSANIKALYEAVERERADTA
ncbi:4-hydroxyphenylpyruvate dioxygenase [Actinacidiphila sp. ITFR-21]|uniref:4-hydroxyphenylpyruvate dioxygenase n=1 Tax=Actinacidiphila sp. ITFR-21 TaxID=3075199 RepID=UPI0028893346|nr:4-hydroxyphenylpyruvate dioxygenase [Streptomyces sp. ITFR-21]WNI19408.1 4-hydroxyphenylpyruvate dioxygenase [Streptomyces sp. ITFR-21]